MRAPHDTSNDEVESSKNGGFSGIDKVGDKFACDSGGNHTKVSEVHAGKRAIDLRQAGVLAARFGVPMEGFVRGVRKIDC